MAAIMTRIDGINYMCMLVPTTPALFHYVCNNEKLTSTKEIAIENCGTAKTYTIQIAFNLYHATAITDPSVLHFVRLANSADDTQVLAWENAGGVFRKSVNLNKSDMINGGIFTSTGTNLTKLQLAPYTSKLTYNYFEIWIW